MLLKYLPSTCTVQRKHASLLTPSEEHPNPGRIWRVLFEQGVEKEYSLFKQAGQQVLRDNVAVLLFLLCASPCWRQKDNFFKLVDKWHHNHMQAVESDVKQSAM